MEARKEEVRRLAKVLNKAFKAFLDERRINAVHGFIGEEEIHMAYNCSRDYVIDVLRNSGTEIKLH